ncbi:hypothetical protein EBB79_17140 [Parasedimentitalea marina]|uniref:Uncharacterized protein n=1 Tax=Parasedimentitalea marina TaxID=2483033 RepID=A0A3T0N634_9RHOB|nr:hypothetical protein EBB79_17140 [Parasedimentitalea marina]
MIRDRISAEIIENFAAREGYEHDRIFVNMIPIIIGSGSEFINELKPHIHATTTEAEHFVFHFENVEQANFADPQFVELTSTVFG